VIIDVTQLVWYMTLQNQYFPHEMTILPLVKPYM